MTSKRPKKTINELKFKLEEYDKHTLLLQEEGEKLIRDVFNVYIEKDKQESLIAEMEETCFSKSKTEAIKEFFSNYNTDDIDINVVRTIIEAENHISQHRKENGFFSTIANVFLSEN